MKANDSAFPADSKLSESHNGLTKRDFIAIQAMKGLVAHSGSMGSVGSPSTIAERAYEIADCLIIESNR